MAEDQQSPVRKLIRDFQEGTDQEVLPLAESQVTHGEHDLLPRNDYRRSTNFKARVVEPPELSRLARKAPRQKRPVMFGNRKLRGYDLHLGTFARARQGCQQAPKPLPVPLPRIARGGFLGEVIGP